MSSIANITSNVLDEVKDPYNAVPKYIPKFAEEPKVINKASDVAMGKSDFLRLICTQLQNQNPLEPMKDTEFISQMASFTSLEHMTEVRNLVEDVRADSFLGKIVTVIRPRSTPLTGLVEGVNTKNGDPYIIIDGTEYPVQDVRHRTLASLHMPPQHTPTFDLPSIDLSSLINQKQISENLVTPSISTSTSSDKKADDVSSVSEFEG